MPISTKKDAVSIARLVLERVQAEMVLENEALLTLNKEQRKVYRYLKKVAKNESSTNITRMSNK